MTVSTRLSPRPSLFGGAAFELTELDAGQLQAFLDANPEYFLVVGDLPPSGDEAQKAFRDLPPPHLKFNGRWLIGFTDDTGRLIGMASVLSDFLVPHVWHVGLFIVATALHGSGTAAALYQSLEDWMKAHGAAWVRLGVVLGNEKGERFWQKVGYTEVRKRFNVPAGERRNTVLVLVKPLAGGEIGDYLQLVERDRPESTLP